MCSTNCLLGSHQRVKRKSECVLRFLRSFFQTGLFQLVVMKKGVGESYHLGAGNVDLGVNNEIIGSTNCHIFGALALSEVLPGPVTSHALYDVARYIHKLRNG